MSYCQYQGYPGESLRVGKGPAPNTFPNEEPMSISRVGNLLKVAHVILKRSLLEGVGGTKPSFQKSYLLVKPHAIGLREFKAGTQGFLLNRVSMQFRNQGVSKFAKPKPRPLNPTRSP